MIFRILPAKQNKKKMIDFIIYTVLIGGMLYFIVKAVGSYYRTGDLHA